MHATCRLEAEQAAVEFLDLALATDLAPAGLRHPLEEEPVHGGAHAEGVDAGASHQAPDLGHGLHEADLVLLVIDATDAEQDAAVGRNTAGGAERSSVPLGEELAVDAVRQQFEPGGLHIMLFDLKAPLSPGDQVPITLTFSDGSSKAVTAEVRSVQGMMKH